MPKATLAGYRKLLHKAVQFRRKIAAHRLRVGAAPGVICCKSSASFASCCAGVVVVLQTARHAALGAVRSPRISCRSAVTITQRSSTPLRL